MIQMRWGRCATACLAVGAMLLLTVAPAFAEAPGADSPEALLERMKRASENEDLPEMMACLSPKARGQMASMMYLMATMVVAFAQMGVEMGSGMAEGLAGDATDEQKAEVEAQKQKALAEAAALRESYNAMVSKYGLPVLPEEGEAEMPEQDAETLFENIDHAAFMADVFAFLESMPGKEESEAEGEESKSPMDIGEGVMTDLAIDGDAATAKIDGEDVRFVRIDGRWFFDAENFMGGPGAP